MALTHKQRRVIHHILSVGRKEGATRRELLSALATAKVEANYRNPRHGHGTSVGWRQEIDTYGSAGKRLNVRGAARRYFREAKALRGKKLSAGELAQAVQRSAYPDKYGKVIGEAKAVLAKHGKGGGGGGGSVVTPVRAPRLVPGRTVVDKRGAVFDALLAGAGGRRRGSLTGDIMRRVSSGQYTRQTDPKVIRGKVDRSPLPGGGADQLRGKDGKLVGKPSDRAGAPTRKAILDFARKTAGIYGKPIKLGTGTAHSKMTVSGNVSAHWTGNALDLPASGQQLIRMGRAALVAAGMPRSRARKIRGGLFNVGGYQIIFNTNEGGDHFGHLHVGRRG